MSFHDLKEFNNYRGKKVIIIYKKNSEILKKVYSEYEEGISYDSSIGHNKVTVGIVNNYDAESDTFTETDISESDLNYLSEFGPRDADALNNKIDGNSRHSVWENILFITIDSYR